ncbi:MAG TPA: hypothetical protein VI685_15995 [Candidatus Angelobacter sp.]
MARWEQYQIWVQKGERWEMVAGFSDFEIASALARNHSSRMRLIHATYEGDKIVAQDVLVEMGATRKSST